MEPPDRPRKRGLPNGDGETNLTKKKSRSNHEEGEGRDGDGDAADPIIVSSGGAGIVASERSVRPCTYLSLSWIVLLMSCSHFFPQWLLEKCSLFC